MLSNTKRALSFTKTTAGELEHRHPRSSKDKKRLVQHSKCTENCAPTHVNAGLPASEQKHWCGCWTGEPHHIPQLRASHNAIFTRRQPRTEFVQDQTKSNKIKRNQGFATGMPVPEVNVPESRQRWRSRKILTTRSPGQPGSERDVVASGVVTQLS